MKRLGRVYTTHDVARLLSCDPSSVAKWIDAGKLSAFRTPGGHRRVKEADLRAFASTLGVELDAKGGAR